MKMQFKLFSTLIIVKMLIVIIIIMITIKSSTILMNVQMYKM